MSYEITKDIRQYFKKNHDKIYLQSQLDLLQNLIELCNNHNLDSISKTTLQEFMVASEKKYSTSKTKEG
ncbi:MAG: hypothetical protein ACREAK_08150 [Nitrosarchaeum sp.]